MREPDPHRRVELWLREPFPYGAHDRQQQVLDRLQALAAVGVVDELETALWGRHVPAAPPPDAPAVVREVRATVEAFAGWAGVDDPAAMPGFTRSRWTGEAVAEPVEVIGLPVFCLALYEDSTLAAVAPCWRSEGVETVDDCLAALEDVGDHPAPTPHEPSSSEAPVADPPERGEPDA